MQLNHLIAAGVLIYYSGLERKHPENWLQLKWILLCFVRGSLISGNTDVLRLSGSKPASRLSFPQEDLDMWTLMSIQMCFQNLDHDSRTMFYLIWVLLQLRTRCLWTEKCADVCYCALFPERTPSSGLTKIKNKLKGEEKENLLCVPPGRTEHQACFWFQRLKLSQVHIKSLNAN